MIVSCLVLVWLFGGQPSKKVEPIPTDGLIEAVASVQESMQDPPQPSPVNKPAKKEILIFVGKTCPPCEKWKRVEMQKFIDAGWSVGIVEVHRFSITPTFEITGSETVTHQGYLTFEQAKGKLK